MPSLAVFTSSWNVVHVVGMVSTSFSAFSLLLLFPAPLGCGIIFTLSEKRRAIESCVSTSFDHLRSRLGFFGRGCVGYGVLKRIPLSCI